MNVLPSDICEKCQKRKTCTFPCAPVEKDLDLVAGRMFEKHDRDEKNRLVRVRVFLSKKREYNFTTLQGHIREADWQHNPLHPDNVSAEDYHSFWSDVVTIHTQSLTTAVFCERVFNQMTFPDIAEKYDTTENNVFQCYRQALDKLFKVLTIIDDPRLRISKSRLFESLDQEGRYSKRQKAWLLYNLIDFDTNEIARLLMSKPENIASYVRETQKAIDRGANVFRMKEDTWRGSTVSELTKDYNRNGAVGRYKKQQPIKSF